jgi:hypothetical protein
MDKLIEEKYMGYYLTKFPLSHAHNIYLVRGFLVDKDLKERYVTDIIFMCGEELITTSTTDSIQFNEELALFDRGDENNKFLKIVQQKGKDSGLVYSLKLSLDSGNTIYIGKSEAKAMNRIWEMSLQRLTFARMMEAVSLTEAQDWSEELFRFNLISNETYQRTMRPL